MPNNGPHHEFEPDVVVVGSGAGGGMAAYVLTRAGIKTLILEAGRNYDPVTEAPMFQWNYQAPLLGNSTPDKHFGFYDATVNGGWEVPGEPYTNAPGSIFRWWRSRMLGGRTNHWGRHVPRFGPYDFKAFSRDGLGTDWPISYADIAPWYDRTEKLIGVSGTNNGLENHPDSSPDVLLPPSKPRITELAIRAAAEDLGIPCVPARQAVLTRAMPHPHAPRQACFNATSCGRGCGIGAAFQTTTSLLPMAMGTGKLRIRTDAMVSRIVSDARGRAKGVEYFDKTDGTTHFVKARAVILAASACETARLLLNSHTAQSPQGLANSSGQVGRNLVDTTGTNVTGHIPALEGRPRYNEDGMDVPHLYIPFWLYQEQAAGKLDFPRGYHYELGGRFGLPGDDPASSLQDGYGPSLKEDARRYYGAQISLTVRGEMIPNQDSYCELDPDTKDRFGLPVLRFHWKFSDHEYRQIAHGIKTAHQIVERLGGRVLTPAMPPERAIADGGWIIHEVGTTRMGQSPSDSVTDGYGHSWDVDNLVIADGGVFPSNAHKNPTLTIMALAWRSTDHLVSRLRKGEV